MGDFGKHEPYEVQIDDEDVQLWLTENKGTVNHEVLTAAEKFVYDEMDEPVCAVVLNVGGSKYEVKGEAIDVLTITIVVGKTEIDEVLSSINTWAIENEEYEMCQRIKNLNEYIEENELQFTDKSDI